MEDGEDDTEDISAGDTNMDQTEESHVIGSVSGGDQTTGSLLKSSGLGEVGAGKQRRQSPLVRVLTEGNQVSNPVLRNGASEECVIRIHDSYNERL